MRAGASVLALFYVRGDPEGPIGGPMGWVRYKGARIVPDVHTY